MSKGPGSQRPGSAPGRHFLQIPGPTNVPDRVLRAMDYPTMDHRGPAFADVGGKALEGMKHESLWGGTVFMRPKDHQAIQDVHIMIHTDEGVTHDLDNSGYGLLAESTVMDAAMDSATSCKMKRPS